MVYTVGLMYLFLEYVLPLHHTDLVRHRHFTAKSLFEDDLNNLIGSKFIEDDLNNLIGTKFIEDDLNNLIECMPQFVVFR